MSSELVFATAAVAFKIKLRSSGAEVSLVAILAWPISVLLFHQRETVPYHVGGYFVDTAYCTTSLSTALACVFFCYG